MISSNVRRYSTTSMIMIKIQRYTAVGNDSKPEEHFLGQAGLMTSFAFCASHSVAVGSFENRSRGVPCCVVYAVYKILLIALLVHKFT